jgi:hypothetical protein
MSTDELRRPVGLAAVIAPGLSILSDAVELLGGGFSPFQLSVTYVGFLAVPFVVLGLHASQQPRGGWLSLAGAVAYGTAFIFFAGTVVHALAQETRDYAALVGQLGLLYPVHGGLMVVGGVLFGLAVARAGVLPRWTGILLVAGALLNLLLALLPLPEASQVAGSVLRNVAFIGMGTALLSRP